MVRVRLTTLGSLPPGVNICLQMVFLDVQKQHMPITVCYHHSRGVDSNKLRSSIADFVFLLEKEDYSVISLYRIGDGHPIGIVSRPRLSASGALKLELKIRFTDLSSCVGGINRQEVAVVFTLFQANTPLGVKYMPVKICKSPWRDIILEEERKRQPTEVAP